MIYFIGIKGTGMAALATMLYDLGYEVMGSDIEKHFFTGACFQGHSILINWITSHEMHSLQEFPMANRIQVT